MQPRLAAARVLQAVRQGQSLSRALPAVFDKTPLEARATVHSLVHGVLRQYERIDALLTLLMRKPLKPKDRIVSDLLGVALFELMDAETPDYAIVDGTVRLVRQQRAWAAGMSNAVLRRFIRERQALLAKVMESPAARWCLPAWLLERLQKAWPGSWESAVAAMAVQPPLTLRVDLSRGSREQCLRLLERAGVSVRPHSVVSSAIELERGSDVTRLPGFREGRITVQDAAAQLAAELLDVLPGQRILDACAAPGGKTTHILEATGGEAEVVALERDPGRAERLRENITRSAYPATIVTADTAEPGGWWDGRRFDRILLDAPCSATGVIRRHPDIKRHRRPEDVEALLGQQRRLLDALWPLLEPGGRLLYATCSILPEENDHQVRRFLGCHDDATVRTIAGAWGRPTTTGRQILPGEAGMDGFFYALVEKRRAKLEPARDPVVRA